MRSLRALLMAVRALSWVALLAYGSTAIVAPAHAALHDAREAPGWQSPACSLCDAQLASEPPPAIMPSLGRRESPEALECAAVRAALPSPPLSTHRARAPPHD